MKKRGLTSTIAVGLILVIALLTHLLAEDLLHEFLYGILLFLVGYGLGVMGDG